MSNYYSPFEGQNAGENSQINMFYIERARQEKRAIRKLGNIIGCGVLMYIIGQFATIYIIQALGLSDKLQTSSVFEDGVMIVALEVMSVLVPFLVIALLNRNKFDGEIVPSKKLSVGTTFLWVGFGMLCCVCANYLVSIMTAVFNSFGFELTQSEMLEPNSAFACISSVFATAVIPAICEEFAMRCVSLGLIKKYGKAFGVVAISIVFGLMHGNVIQFVFAFACGLILGYVTVKTDSIVPAMLIHGFNNGMSAASSILVYVFGEKIKPYTILIFFAIWLIIGIVSTIVLLMRGQFKSDEKGKQHFPYENSFGAKLRSFFLVPGMIVPFVFLIFSTISTIQKV